jgi:hypothetical protein
MDMRIDEARHDEMWPVIDRLDILRRLLADHRIVADRRDLPTLDQQTSILVIDVAAVVLEVFRLAQKGEKTATEQSGHEKS